MITQHVTLSNALEGKNKKWNNFQSWISANRPFMNPGPGRLVLYLLVIVFDLCQEDPLNSFSSFPLLRFS